MWSMGLLFAMFLLFHDISILVQHKAASTCHENYYFFSNIFLLYIPFRERSVHAVFLNLKQIE